MSALHSSQFREELIISTYISILALLVSSIALYISYRKDTFQVRLELNRSNVYRDFLTIINDSTSSMQVQAIGVARSDCNIEWVEKTGCSETNKGVNFPRTIGGHLSFEASLEQPNSKYAYCVQLPCGRTFVINQSLIKDVYRKLYYKSLISRITRGRKGFTKSYVHLRDYGVR